MAFMVSGRTTLRPATSWWLPKVSRGRYPSIWITVSVLRNQLRRNSSPTPVTICLKFSLRTENQSIRNRAGMYFGNDVAASHIWSMISGCRWAEIDETGEPGKACAFQIQFQSWVEERFPFSRGIPWHRTFYFVLVSSSGWSLKTFFNHLDLFQAGERPDCLSQTARMMMKSIAEKCGCDPADMENMIKRIAPI